MKRLLKLFYMLLYHPLLFFKIGELGKNVLIGKWLEIKNADKIYIKNNVRIGHSCRVSIIKKFNNELFNPKVCIDEYTYIGNRFTILCAEEIKIGKNVLIASDVMITSENHGIDPLNELNYNLQSLETKPVFIDDGVWIGEKVSILPGVIIGKKSIIGANSVVSKSIPEYSIAVGSPAKVIKRFNFEKKRWEKI